MYAKHPKLAREFEAKTPKDKKIPMKKELPQGQTRFGMQSTLNGGVQATLTPIEEAKAQAEKNRQEAMERQQREQWRADIANQPGQQKLAMSKAWTFLKATRQTELGEFHPDLPSSYGPVRGYRAIPERFIPETRQHGFVPQSTESWKHAHQHGNDLPKEAIWAFMAERGYPTNIARKMGWRFGVGQAEGEHDWLTDWLDPVEVDDSWSEEEKKEWENDIEHFKREKMWPPWDKRVNEGLHPTWRLVPIRGDHWQRQRDMSDQGRSDFSRPATGGIFSSPGGEDQRGTDKAAPDWDSYMITEPIPPEALVHGDTNYNLNNMMRQNAIEDEMYGRNKADAWKVRGYLQP